MHDYANEMHKAVMSGSLQHQQTHSANIKNGRERKLKKESERAVGTTVSCWLGDIVRIGG